jgi:D-sedoheptulose 7-phosphate isomerase
MRIDEIRAHFEQHQQVISEVSALLSGTIDQCCTMISNVFESRNKVLIMGNGGSAADAQHFAAELVGRFLIERQGLPAIAMTTDSSILTAIGNDYGFDEIFRRQVMALAVPGDVVIGISTSGCSRNILCALTTAKEIGCHTIGLLGRDGGTIGGIVDINLTVPSQDTPRIQEAHSAIIHIICDLVEKCLFS